MLVLFETLTPVCMLVIEAFQSSIAMRFQKNWVGLFLQCALLDRDRCWKTTPYTGVEEEPEVCHM